MADANMSYVYTIGGYATLIGLGYALYHVSTHKPNNRRGSAAPAAPVTRTAKSLHEATRKEDRKKKQRMETFASEAQDSAKAKARAAKAPEEPNTRLKSVAADTSDDDADNREFARQLAKAQEGTNIASKADGPKQREKSVKQSRAVQISDHVAEDKSSAPSSTTGADADDDQSPLMSPEALPADVSGVSDMLEEPARSGPSVLRITDAEPKKQKPKADKAPDKAETKKQRQNRKKAETAKAAREEAEKERKALEEKQRRTARIAEGRAAKDGSQFQAINGTNSAWSSQAVPFGGSSANKAPNATLVHQPLDTFEQQAATASKQPTTVKQPSAITSDSSWMSSLPSEEEQMEMLKDEADEWSTVKTKAFKKPVSKKASSVSSADDKTPSQPQPVTQPKQPTTGTTTKPLRGTPAQNFGGSFSALTANDDGAEDAEEEEWDV